MKNVLSSYGTKFSAFCCGLFGHHYSVTKKVTMHIKEYQCIHCGKQVSTDVQGNLSKLTPQRRDINKTLQDLYIKRNRANAPQHLA